MRRSWRLGATVGVAVLLLTMVAGGSVQAHGKNTITAVNKFSFEPNRALNVEFRFKPGTLRIGSGERLTFQQGPVVPDVFPPDPHTLSIVHRGDVPRTIEEVLTCPACGPFFEEHDPGNDQEPPFNYVVNEGPPGLNQPGDSLLIDAEHPVTRARVTAAPGTTLQFICVIHPWMQGKLKVT
jgi:hypothetical protein